VGRAESSGVQLRGVPLRRGAHVPCQEAPQKRMPPPAPPSLGRRRFQRAPARKRARRRGGAAPPTRRAVLHRLHAAAPQAQKVIGPSQQVDALGRRRAPPASRGEGGGPEVAGWLAAAPRRGRGTGAARCPSHGPGYRAAQFDRAYLNATTRSPSAAPTTTVVRLENPCAFLSAPMVLLCWPDCKQTDRLKTIHRRCTLVTPLGPSSRHWAARP
jgi:hypothetical protein